MNQSLAVSNSTRRLIQKKSTMIQSQRNLMYQFSEEDFRISEEVYTRFEEFITAPEKTDIWLWSAKNEND